MGKFVVKAASSGYTFNLVAANGEVIGVSEVYATKAACLDGVESVRKHSAKAKIEDQTAGGEETNPKFEIYLDSKEEYRFRLKASNGEIILASEGYSSKDGCKNGIESVVKSAADSDVEMPE